jgi:hypothetical protein
MVEWSKAYTGASPASSGFNYVGVIRPCGVALQSTSIPATLAGAQSGSSYIYVPDPLLVVDVSITFKPWVFSFITGPFTLSATSYVPVRTSLAKPTDASNPDDFITLTDPSDPFPNSVCTTPAGT